MMSKYEYCKEITKQSSVTFDQAFSQLKTAEANAMYAIYAFYQMASDAVRGDQNSETLTQYEAQINAIYKGDTIHGLMFQALAETIRAYKLPAEPFKAFLTGLKKDLSPPSIVTDEDLDAYCYRAASTVIMICVPVLVSKQKSSQKLNDVVSALGKAMQITTMLRDVREDLMKHRVYFPNDVLDQHQVIVETLNTGIITPEYRSMIEMYIEKAKALYQVFYDNIDLLDQDTRLPIYLAVLYHESILTEIRRRKHDNLTKHHSIGFWRRARLTKWAKKDLTKKGLIE